MIPTPGTGSVPPTLPQRQCHAPGGTSHPPTCFLQDSSRGAWAGVSGQRGPCPLHSPYQNQLESRLQQVQTFDPFNEASVLYTAFTDGGKALSSHVRGESTAHQPRGTATRELVSGSSELYKASASRGRGDQVLWLEAAPRVGLALLCGDGAGLEAGSGSQECPSFTAHLPSSSGTLQAQAARHLVSAGGPGEWVLGAQGLGWGWGGCTMPVLQHNAHWRWAIRVPWPPHPAVALLYRGASRSSVERLGRWSAWGLGEL